MTSLSPTASAALDDLLREAADGAVETDATGQFPTAVIDGFRRSGLAGLMSASEIGGHGAGLRQASEVVERLARADGSSAMIVAMHYSAVAVVEPLAPEAVRRRVASGDALLTLAFSEAGSRSHFWAPLSTARRDGDAVVLDARKSWVTSAGHADLYIWSSQATTGEGSAIWLVPRAIRGIANAGAFDGMGLRGNDSAPVTAIEARIPADHLLGEDGKGGDVMLGIVLPAFAVLNASAALGIATAAVERTIAHVSGTSFAHLDQALSGFPTIRAYIARMQLKTDLVRALLGDTLSALEGGSEAAMLRVLEIKAAAGEAATEVTDLAMRVCGGMAFRKEVGLDRYFRDARANTVMAPTTDQLYDFIGRAVCGLDLFA